MRRILFAAARLASAVYHPEPRYAEPGPEMVGFR